MESGGRSQAFAAMEQDAETLGRWLCTAEAVNEPDRAMSECREMALAVLSGISLDLPEWAPEVTFGDAVDALTMHRLWCARRIRADLALADYNQEFGGSLRVQDFADALELALGELGLLKASPQISLGRARLIVNDFASQLATGWIHRGGAAVPPQLVVSIVAFSAVLPRWVDEESTYRYGETGFPVRMLSEAMAGEFEGKCLEKILAEVRGKLPFSASPWAGFDLVGCVTAAVRRGRFYTPDYEKIVLDHW